MWQSGNGTLWHFDIALFSLNRDLCPMFAIGFLYPSIAFPPGDDVAQGRLTTIATLQRAEVIHCERGCQLIEHRVIGSIALALVLSIDILILQCLTEGLNLLTQTILGHHQSKLDRRSPLLPPPMRGGLLRL